VAAAAAPAAARPLRSSRPSLTILTGVGAEKIKVIKEIRTLTGLGLKEAKAVVDEAPKPVKEKVSKEEAENIRKVLEGAGATVQVK
jgi:large subunit ribosomal protein L7/L12